MARASKSSRRKLFGDKKGKHHWSRVVSDVTQFETGLLGHVGMDANAFQAEIKKMRLYRTSSWRSTRLMRCRKCKKSNNS